MLCPLNMNRNYARTWLITSSAKFATTFSIPSPTSKRMNDLIVDPLFAANLATVTSPSLTNGCYNIHTSAKNLRIRPSTIFSTMLAGFPSFNAS